MIQLIFSIIWLIPAIGYLILMYKAEKARVRYEKKYRQYSEIVDEVSKLWVSSGIEKDVYYCEKCHEKVALATIEHKLLCKVCYEEKKYEEK